MPSIQKNIHKMETLQGKPAQGHQAQENPLQADKKSFSLRTLGLIFAGVIVLLDQASKLLISKTFYYGEFLDIFPGFGFTLRHNTGAAFSVLANESGWQRWFFVGIAAVISTIIVIWLGRLNARNAREKIEAIALALILGGALGNVIDRIIQGYVVDFILVYYQNWQFPAFNIADSAISLGVFLYIVSLFKKEA